MEHKDFINQGKELQICGVSPIISDIGNPFGNALVFEKKHNNLGFYASILSAPSGQYIAIVRRIMDNRNNTKSYKTFSGAFNFLKKHCKNYDF